MSQHLPKLKGFVYQPNERELDYDDYDVNFLPGSMCVDVGPYWAMVEFIRRSDSDIDACALSYEDLCLIPYGKQHLTTQTFREPFQMKESAVKVEQNVLFRPSLLRRYKLDSKGEPSELDQHTDYGGEEWARLYACHNLVAGRTYKVERVVEPSFIKVYGVGVVLSVEVVKPD